jgi:hypothetical protein
MEAVSLKASTGDSYPALNPIDLIPFVTYTERIETAPYRLHILHLQDCIQRFIFPARLPTWQLRKFPLKVRYFSSSKRLRRICLRFDSFQLHHAASEAFPRHSQAEGFHSTTTKDRIRPTAGPVSGLDGPSRRRVLPQCHFDVQEK